MKSPAQRLGVLRQRVELLEKIVAAVDRLEEYTGQMAESVVNLRARFVEAAGSLYQGDVMTLLEKTKTKLCAIEERSEMVLTTVNSTTSDVVDLVVNPSRLAEDLEDSNLEFFLRSRLEAVERHQLDVESQILEISAIDDDLVKVLHENKFSS